MRNEFKHQRLIDKFNFELGPAVLSYLSDPDVKEIMLNPDGQLWIDSQTKGLCITPEEMDAITALQLLGSIAEFSGTVINESNPILETELPFTSYRFAGTIPPIVKAPCFTIRKQCCQVLTLDDYENAGVITPSQTHFLRDCIDNHKTILIAGGPGTGKTTFANALLQDLVDVSNLGQRIVLIEDTQELQCVSTNHVALKTSEYADYDRLLKLTLRLRPDVICLGECRGKEMLTLLQAWNTGTQGGMATIHANNAASALLRVVDLASESGCTISPHLVCESIKVIVVMDFDTDRGRHVSELKLLTGYQGGNYVLESYE